MVDTNNIIRVFLGYLNNLSVEMSAIYLLGILLLIYNYVFFRVTRARDYMEEQLMEQLEESSTYSAKLVRLNKELLESTAKLSNEKAANSVKNINKVASLNNDIEILNKENKELKEHVRLAPKWDDVHTAIQVRDDKIVSFSNDISVLKELNTSLSDTVRTLNEKLENTNNVHLHKEISSLRTNLFDLLQDKEDFKDTIKAMQLTERILIDNGLELVKTMSEDELIYNEIIDIALFDREVK